MPGTLVRPRRSTRIASRSPSAHPAADASRVSGATPVPSTTMSAGTGSPSTTTASASPSRAISPTVAPVRTRTPAPASAAATGAAATGDRAGSTCGAISTTVTCAPAGQERLGDLEPDRPAAHQHRPRTVVRRERRLQRARRPQVAQHVDAGVVDARDPRAHGPRARRDDEGPVRDLLPAGQRHPPGGRVDPRHLDAGADVDVARPPELLGRRGDQRVEGPHLAGDDVGDPARRVRRVGPRLEHRDRQGGVGAARLGGRRHPGGVATDDDERPHGRAGPASAARR